MKKYLLKRQLNPSKNRESLWHLNYHLLPPSSCPATSLGMMMEAPTWAGTAN